MRPERRASALVVAAMLAILAVAGVAVRASAHDEHGGPARAHSLAPPIVVQGFRIELISEGSLEPGQEGQITVRLSREGPVSGADVRIGVTPVKSSGANGDDADLAPAEEMTVAGSYTVPFIPDGAGRHRVDVQIAGAEGRQLTPPVVVSIDVDVAAAPGVSWMPIVGAALVGALALAAIRVRVRHPRAAADLLALPRLSRVLLSPFLQPALQLPLLVITGIVVFLGFVDVQDAGTNVAPRLTWTIWWAGVVFTLLIAGRVWCVVCPFGALNEWTARASGAWRRLPRIFRNLWWATALFVLLTLADEQLGVVRRPSITAWIIVGLAVFAIVLGLRYERRSFCRWLCPIGGLLGLYSMTAPVEVRPKDGAVCRAHPEKECYRGGRGTSGCPMFEFPGTIDRNTYCTFCLECARGCGRHNVAVRLRALGRDLWTTTRRTFDEAYLALTLVGLTVLVTARMLTAWPSWIAALADRVPAALHAWMAPETYLVAMDSAALLVGALVVTPLATFGVAALANRLAGSAGVGARRTFVQFAYMFVPIALGLHLAHNASHLLLEGPAVVPALQRAVATFTPWTIGQPDWRVAALATAPTIAAVQHGLMFGALALSLVAGHRLSLRIYADRGVASRVLVPFLLLSVVFTAAGLAVLGLPMAMRHAM